MTIYLDNHSTTCVDPRVLERMLPYFSTYYGNPASKTHSYGWKAEEAVEEARDEVAKSINAQSSEIIFTSGATESNNLALHNRAKIITSQIEHSSVYNMCRKKALDKTAEVFEIKSDRYGVISLDHASQLSCLCNPEIVSVMLVNHEVGSIQPISSLRSIFPKALIHCDMAQALGKIPIDVKKLGVDFASISAHKIYGPKGIGALYVSSKIQDKLEPLMFGGRQEVGFRPGTLNVPAIVGFGEACRLIDLDEECERITKLRTTFFNSFVNYFHFLFDVNGPDDNVAGNLNFATHCNNMDRFVDIVAPQVAFSFGSACESGDVPSRTLRAMSVPDEEISSSIRLCFGRFNTQEEIIQAAKIMCEAIDIINEECNGKKKENLER
jgi:cysteine desulfurase